MTIHMRIMQDNVLIVDLPKWPGPIPRVGDAIFHPPHDALMPAGVAGHVKTVTWRTHDRITIQGKSQFVMTAHPYVEIYI